MPSRLQRLYGSFVRGFGEGIHESEEQSIGEEAFHRAPGARWAPSSTPSPSHFTQLTSRLRHFPIFLCLQIVARKATTVSAKDLEDFDSAFRSFDKDQQGGLDLDQLAGALGALGVAEIVSDASLYPLARPTEGETGIEMSAERAGGNDGVEGEEEAARRFREPGRNVRMCREGTQATLEPHEMFDLRRVRRSELTCSITSSPRTLRRFMPRSEMR